MITRTFPILAAVLALFVIGCDFSLEGRGDYEKRKAALDAERTRLEEERAEKARMKESLGVYFKEKRLIAEERMAGASNAISRAAIDAEAVAATADSADGDWLVRLLEDAKVAALARKYLSRDFTVDLNEYLVVRKDLAARWKEYETARRKANARYEKESGERGDFEASVKTRHDEEIRRLRNEIANLERRLEAVRKEYRHQSRSMLLVDSHNRYRNQSSADREYNDKNYELQHRITEIDRELLHKRRELDILLSPHYTARIEAEAARDKQSLVDNAGYSTRRELDDIDRRMKPKKTLPELDKEYARATIGALRDAISRSLESATSDYMRAKSLAALAREAVLKVPFSDVDELKKLVTRINKLEE